MKLNTNIVEYCYGVIRNDHIVNGCLLITLFVPLKELSEYFNKVILVSNRETSDEALYSKDFDSYALLNKLLNEFYVHKKLLLLGTG